LVINCQLFGDQWIIENINHKLLSIYQLIFKYYLINVVNSSTYMCLKITCKYPIKFYK
jgi:hypothetical protein